MKPVSIGGVMVGDGHPPVFVAEIGTFFNKDIELAECYLRAAVDAGAPVLKTEILHDADVCLKGTGLRHEYRHADGIKVEDYRALIERKVVPLGDYRRLFSLCEELRVPLIATVYDVEGIDFLVEAGGAAIKIARDNINNIPLIRYAARTGRPVIFDAGIVYFDEVARAVRLAQSEGVGGVVVNHHPGANPAPPEVHNMRVMQTYKEALRVPVGLACHYRGDEILYLAVGMGANLLEKGVVDDPDRIEQDLVSAARLRDVKEIVRKVSNCWKAIGQAPARHKEPRDLSVRKGLVAKRVIAAGEVFALDNVRFSWPPLGISVEYWDLVAASRAARTIQANEVIRWSDVRLER
ncbi:MAG: N-acetylneuraminate synthase family protein [Candidatus Rokubacteria bacterium]|nr:N-acetylneuraminate synthase family protein [Candidatus Rokubacteria bacterium]